MLFTYLPFIVFFVSQLVSEDMTSIPQAGMPSLSDLPVALQLAETFSQTSLGLSAHNPFENWSQNRSIKESTTNQRRAILEWQQVLTRDIDLCNVTKTGDASAQTYYLTDNIKFTVASPASFTESLSDCALKQGYLLYNPTQLQDAIDASEIPQKMYISQKQICRNEEISAFQSTISSNSEACAIWQKSDLTGLPEVISGDGCLKPLPTLCLYNRGVDTHSHQSMVKIVKRGFVISAQHVFYLLSQLLNYPTPHVSFASDITVHLTEAFRHYANKVENQIASDQYTYEISFAMQHCTALVQLALQKAQHSEHWHSQQRQQENFGKIKKQADGFNRVMENLLVNVKAHHDDDDDDCDRHNENGDTKGGNAINVKAGSGLNDGGDNDHNNDKDNDNEDHHNDDTNGGEDNGDHDDDDNHNDHNNTVVVGQSNDTEYVEDNSNVTVSTVRWYQFWKWFASEENNISSNDTIVNDDISGDPDPDPDSEIRKVCLWPFAQLISLAMFNLFTIIEFFINLVWKILTALLAVYIWTLGKRIHRLECIVSQLQKDKKPQRKMCTFKHPDKVKQVTSKQAKNDRFALQDIRSDPDCVQQFMQD